MTLQDSKLPSLFPRRFYLDIVDDDWIADTLSDDGVSNPYPAMHLLLKTDSAVTQRSMSRMERI